MLRKSQWSSIAQKKLHISAAENIRQSLNLLTVKYKEKKRLGREKEIIYVLLSLMVPSNHFSVNILLVTIFFLRVHDAFLEMQSNLSVS